MNPLTVYHIRNKGEHLRKNCIIKIKRNCTIGIKFVILYNTNKILYYCTKTTISNDTPADTSHRINVDLMSILRRHIEKKISMNFHVISTYILRCNFDGTKIDVISMYFVWRNFDEQNIDVGAMYFSQPDFKRQKINVVLVCFLM